MKINIDSLLGIIEKFADRYGFDNAADTATYNAAREMFDRGDAFYVQKGAELARADCFGWGYEGWAYPRNVCVVEHNDYETELFIGPGKNGLKVIFE